MTHNDVYVLSEGVVTQLPDGLYIGNPNKEVTQWLWRLRIPDC